MATQPDRELVGTLPWLVLETRPDIAFTTMSLTCFGHNPRCIHWEAAKHVLRYFKLGSAVLLYHLLNVLSM